MKPTVDVLIGSPLSGHEARFLRKLYADLEPVGATILANFYARQRQIDFFVVTDFHAALLELKGLPHPVFGHKNGPWTIEEPSGKRVPYAGPNPWHQTLQQKYAVNDEMQAYAQDRRRAFFREFNAYVCIDPEINPRSRVLRRDHRVSVRSYRDVLTVLRTPAKPPSWTRADWIRFATDRLSLERVALSEAIDPTVHAASHALRSYLPRVQALLRIHLPPLLPKAVSRNTGQALLDTLLAGGNHQVVGPSGSAKTFHLHHLAIAAIDLDHEVPLLVDASTYRGRDSRGLLRHETAQMFPGGPQALLDALDVCGRRTLLLVDAFNECPPEHRAELLRDLQALTLDLDARVVFASQTDIDLPEDLPSMATRIELPQPEDKRHIYCFHAGVEVSPDVDYYCQPFANAYELAVAGRCHAAARPPASRTELFDRYVQTCLADDYHVATVLLRAIAVEMAATVSSSWERMHYENFAERFLTDRRGSLTILDKLRSSRLIRINDDYFSFEHELLADYFTATEIHRRRGGSAELPAELRKPRNQPLIELILPRLSDDQEIQAVLIEAMDRRVLSRVLTGRCGKRARAVLLRDIEELFRLAGNDLATIACQCHVVERPDGRRLLSGVTVTGDRDWTAYCARLSKLVAHHLDDPVFAGAFLDLLDRTESTLRRIAQHAARGSRLKTRRVWEQTVHEYGGTLTSSLMTLPCGAMLAELRTALMMGAYPDGSPLWQPLLERVVSTPGSDFALLALFQDKKACSEGDLETILDLVQRAWKSGIYILRVDALDYLRSRPADLSDAATTRIRDTLDAFETDDLMENTVLLEALAAYGGLEAPITPEDALTEMRSMIKANALSDCTLTELARALGSEPRTVLASRARGCLGRIFEDIFQGAYWEAYQELARDEKCALLALALDAPDPGYHSSWLLHELLEHGDSDQLPVYRRLAAGINGRSSFPQESTATFLLAIRGCSRFMDTPPAYTGGDTPSHRAWSEIGRIFFWTFRGSDVGAPLWSRLEGPTRLAVADVLFHIANCEWRLAGESRSPTDLVTEYPDQIRPLLEDCLRNRAGLPTVFNHGGSRDPQVLLYLIDVLGRVGEESTAQLLCTVMDDPELGRRAISAIESIRKTRTGHAAEAVGR